MAPLDIALVDGHFDGLNAMAAQIFDKRPIIQPLGFNLSQGAGLSGVISPRTAAAATMVIGGLWFFEVE